MIAAAGDRPCLEMGSRRTHEQAAVAAARAAYVAGFAATSNLEAGRTYGVPTAGTSAHAFTLLHDDERAAFAAQVACLGTGTTLLVDTYDVPDRRCETAVEVAGPELGAVRLDSGDLLAQAAEVRAAARRARRRRHPDRGDQRPGRARHRRARRRPGRRLRRRHVAWSPAPARPTAGLVYKLVARADDSGALVDVAKKSKDKATRRRPQVGAAPARRRTAWPRPRWSGSASSPVDDGDDRPLLVELRPRRRGGRHRPRPAVAPASGTSGRVPSCRRGPDQLSRGEPAIPTVYENSRA